MNKIWPTRKCWILLILWGLLVNSRALSQYPVRIRQTNEQYEMGDWIGYACGRFVNSIAPGLEHIYFATTGGITRYNFYEDKWDFPWTVCNGLASNEILCVAFDRNTNTLWCATPVSISYYQNFAQVWYNRFYDDLGLNSNEMVVSIGLGMGAAWFETQSGQLIQFQSNFNNFQVLTEIPPGLSGDEIEWYGKRQHVATELPILFMSDGYLFDNRGTITDTNLRKFDISCYFFDKWGYLWIGTWGLGAAKADTRTQQLQLIPFGPYQSNVTAFNYQAEYFGIGGRAPVDHSRTQAREEQGITRWNPSRGIWDYYQAKFLTGFDSDQVNRMVMEPEFWWLATDQGLVEYDFNRNRWTTFTQRHRLRNDQINDLVINADFIWVATPSGIDRLTRRTLHTDSLAVQRIAYRHLREIEVRDLELCGDTLWAGTNAGAYFYDISKDSGDFFEGDWSPGTQTVTAVGSNRTTVWFGHSNGIDAFDLQKNKWLSSPERFTKLNAKVNAIQANEKAVFAATDEGVWKYDLTRRYWKLFNQYDGLISDQVQTVLLDEDYVWFGTDNGFCRFYWNSPYRID
ncbi:hypothetical protein L0128_04810 [candidate division KSB1 bacterium]|nr:hypothetical protein [candidate division KSB1 bacterium]